MAPRLILVTVVNYFIDQLMSMVLQGLVSGIKYWVNNSFKGTNYKQKQKTAIDWQRHLQQISNFIITYKANCSSLMTSL